MNIESSCIDDIDAEFSISVEVDQRNNCANLEIMNIKNKPGKESDNIAGKNKESYEVCKVCNKGFRSVKSVLRHYRSVHNNEPNVESFCTWKEIYYCNVCKYKTNRTDTLKRHMKTHSDKKKFSSIQNCPLCNFQSPRDDMLNHFMTHHEIVMNVEELEFETEGEFYEWKYRVQNEEGCSYSRMYSNKFVDGRKKYTYRCHRDGLYKRRGNNIRHRKVNKINAYCPAGMNVTLHPSGKVLVSFTKTHIGHQGEIAHITLSASERSVIIEKIKAGISLNCILDSVRETISAGKISPAQSFNLKTEDLLNITKDYNLPSRIMRHSSDLISVESWVLEMQQIGNVIRFYKPQGIFLPDYPELLENDFILIIINEPQVEICRQFSNHVICVDDSHDVNSYGFFLTSVIVLDDSLQCFPTAFLFSNRKDFPIMEIFVKNIKDAVGIALRPKVLMTDITDDFHNAWILQMEMPEFHLYCGWHIDRAWRKNLTMIKDKEKQIEIYKIMRTLLEMTDEHSFYKSINFEIVEMKNHADTLEFAQYIEDNYLKSASKWAYCHLHRAGIDANLSLERLHHAMKYIYLKGNKPGRMDFAIHALMRFLQKKLLERLINLNKEKVTSNLLGIRDSHQASLLLMDGSVVKTDDVWKVFSSEVNLFYDVIKSGNNHCNCFVRCEECNVCIHMFECSCMDSTINYNLCKHIHAVCRYLQQSNGSDSELDAYTDHDDLLIHDSPRPEQEYLVVEPLPNEHGTNKCEDIDAERQRLSNEFKVILSEAKTVEDIQEIDKDLKALRHLIQFQQSKLSLCSKHTALAEPSKNTKQKFESLKKFVKKNKVTKASNDINDKISLDFLLFNNDAEEKR